MYKLIKFTLYIIIYNTKLIDQYYKMIKLTESF